MKIRRHDLGFGLRLIAHELRQYRWIEREDEWEFVSEAIPESPAVGDLVHSNIGDPMCSVCSVLKSRK